MKNIFRLMAIVMLLICSTSCSDDDAPEIVRLEVTNANLNGVWQLAEWNGQPLTEDTYCYIKFNRKDQTFEMYQKFDSMYARYITGNFKIRKDPYLGAVISGTYDYGNGDWNNEYNVTELLESGSMVWVAVDDASDIHKYVRCDEVPDTIVEESSKDVE